MWLPNRTVGSQPSNVAGRTPAGHAIGSAGADDRSARPGSSVEAPAGSRPQATDPIAAGITCIRKKRRTREARGSSLRAHGMQEVVGSSPTSSTANNLRSSRFEGQ